MIYEIIVEYQSNKETMYPKYISFNNSFEVLRHPPPLTIDTKINYSIQHSKLTFNSVEITFTNNPILKNVMNKSNYKIRYKNAKLKIDSIEVKNNVALLHLNKKLVFNYNKTNQSNELKPNKDITIKIKNIKDIYGNIANEPLYRSYNQYREFFVQELKFNHEKPLDTLYMIKNQPIFKNQPIVAFKNLSNYWMNTPLKID